MIIKTPILIVFILIILMRIIKSGIINPYGRSPILLSVNNVGLTSSYTFTFTLDTTTKTGHLLVIKPPESQYSSVLTINTAFTAWILPDATDYSTITSTTCTYTSNKEFEILINQMTGGITNPHSIRIDGIINPSTSGGTGNFRLETRQGEINVFDYNHAFGQVGLVAAPTSLSSVSVTITNNPKINQLGTYSIQFTNVNQIPMAGAITIQIPSLLKVQSGFSCTNNVNPSATCTNTDTNNLIINGFSSDIAASSSWTITLTNVLHPPYSVSPGNGLIRTWLNYTNTIIEQSTPTFPTIAADTLSSDPTKLYYTNFNRTGYLLTPSDTISYELTFTTTNPLPSTGTIIIQYPNTYSLANTCNVVNGLIDISETYPVQCAVTSNQLLISSFNQVASLTSITVWVTATHPSTSGSTPNVVITTYYDTLHTLIVDSTTGTLSFSITSGYTLLQVWNTNLANYVAGSSGLWSINWQNQVQFNSGTGGSFSIRFPSSFTILAPICQLDPNGGAPAATISCLYSSTTSTISLNTDGRTYSNTGNCLSILNNSFFFIQGDNILSITGITSPGYAGTYPIEVTISESGVAKRHQTVYVVINPQSIAGYTVTTLTKDTNRPTLFTFSFTCPMNLFSGEWKSNPQLSTTTIVLEFATQSGGVNLYVTDLGTGLTTGSSLPCYGLQNFAPYTTSALIRCRIYPPASASSSNPVVVIIDNFQAIANGAPVQFLIPNIYNSLSTTQTATITIKIRNTVSRITTVTFQSTATMVLPVPNAITKNPNNDNGSGGTSTNYAPSFHPSTVNSNTWTDLYVVPGPNRAVAAGNGLILVFPALSATTPQAYLLPRTGLTCSIGLTNTQVCYSFPEVNWIVIPSLTQGFTVGIQNTLILRGFKAPFYAASPALGMNVISTNNGAEWENITYTPFDSYTPGDVTSININGTSDRSLDVDVGYNWQFTLTNSIPAGGTIALKFPPNWYNLNSNPLPIGTVISGLSNNVGSTITFSFNINVATVSNFAPYTGGTPINIQITGVKNPSSTGLTSYFEIDSYTAEGYTIDSNTIITGKYIYQKRPTGQVTFNYFYTTPWNGQIRANYYLSFYPSVTYPYASTIKITFPATEFSTSDYEYDQENQQCSVSGAIQTLQSCTLSTNTFVLTLDTPMQYVANISPIIVTFPWIVNFNSELSSGNVLVQVLYDGVILDQSGTSSTNRKAITGLLSTLLVTSNFAFKPTTEGQIATYSVVLKPPGSFLNNATIRFEFPNQFIRGLGRVYCTSDIQIPNVPLNCTIQDWVLNVTNHNGYNRTTSPNGFLITFAGIINPNAAPAITKGISAYILDNANNATYYTYSLGALTYTASPKVLHINRLTINTTYTRIPATYSFRIIPTIATVATNSFLNVFFTGSYILQYLAPSLSFTLASSSGAASISDNLASISFPTALATTSFYDFSTNSVINPQDEGYQPYPVIYITTGTTVVVRSYSNLIQPPNLSFAHNGLLILLNNDQGTSIIQGQSRLYTFVFPSAVTSTYQLVPSPLITDVKTSSITISSGEANVSVWIGVKTGTASQLTYLIWTLQGDVAGIYWKIRPLAINILNTTSLITVSSFNSLPAGGRAGPFTVTLTDSPIDDMQVQIYQFGTRPTQINVYPNVLSFSKGVLQQTFWVSAGVQSQGVWGNLIFLITGTNYGSYSLPNRLMNFTVTNGLAAPTPATIVFSSNITAISAKYITMTVSASNRCTVYFFIAPQGTFIPSFYDIRNKTIAYDYYGAEYIAGEYVNETSDNIWNFNITGLRSNTDYTLTLHLQDFFAVVPTMDSPIVLNFTTLGDLPQQIIIPMIQSTMTDTDKQDLAVAIATTIGINVSTIETNLDNLAKTGGQTSTLFSKYPTTGQNAKVKSSTATVSTSYSGFSCVIFPDLYNPFGLAVADAVTSIQASLSNIDTLYHGGGNIQTTGTVTSTPVEPSPIQWGTTSKYTMSSNSTTSSISISGISLNAPGVVVAILYSPQRTYYWSSNPAPSSVVRYLEENISDRQLQTYLINPTSACNISKMNNLTVYCNGASNTAPDNTRQDIAYNLTTSGYATSYQIVTGSDETYYKADRIYKLNITDTSTTFNTTFQNLTLGVNYRLYISAIDGYLKYPMRMIDDYTIYDNITLTPIPNNALRRIIMGLLSIYAILAII